MEPRVPNVLRILRELLFSLTNLSRSTSQIFLLISCSLSQSNLWRSWLLGSLRQPSSAWTMGAAGNYASSSSRAAINLSRACLSGGGPLLVRRCICLMCAGSCSPGDCSWLQICTRLSGGGTCSPLRRCSWGKTCTRLLGGNRGTWRPCCSLGKTCISSFFELWLPSRSLLPEGLLSYHHRGGTCSSCLAYALRSSRDRLARE